MACCNLMKIKNPNYMKIGSYRWYLPFLEVPCGWCLNCRVDRRNWLSDAMAYEFKRFNYRGAFVTFTYDDIHLQDHSNIFPDDFDIVVDDKGVKHKIWYSNNRILNYSLDRDDPKKFLKRLRRKIEYYYKKHKIDSSSPVNELCNSRFMWFQTSEYGGIFQRPHVHFLFFGLDYAFCEDLFKDCWHEGLVDVRPIKDGAFEYVSDYLIKQLHSNQAKEVYDDNGLVRPFSSHSLGLGKGLVLEQLDYILSHNGCYLSDSGQFRPIPIYYRNALHIRMRPDISRVNEQMFQAGISSDLDSSQKYKYRDGSTIRYSLSKINEFRHNQSLLREKHLEAAMRSKGEIPDSCIEYSDYSGIDKMALIALYGSLERYKNIMWIRENVPF